MQWFNFVIMENILLWTVLINQIPKLMPLKNANGFNYTEIGSGRAVTIGK